MTALWWLLLPLGVTLALWGLCVLVARWCDPQREPFGPRAKAHDDSGCFV